MRLVVQGSGDTRRSRTRSGRSRRPTRAASRSSSASTGTWPGASTPARTCSSMPSRFEPCGPRPDDRACATARRRSCTRTGGLADSRGRRHRAPGEGTGFVFDEPTPGRARRGVRARPAALRRCDGAGLGRARRPRAWPSTSAGRRAPRRATSSVPPGDRLRAGLAPADLAGWLAARPAPGRVRNRRRSSRSAAAPAARRRRCPTSSSSRSPTIPVRWPVLAEAARGARRRPPGDRRRRHRRVRPRDHDHGR